MTKDKITEEVHDRNTHFFKCLLEGNTKKGAISAGYYCILLETLSPSGGNGRQGPPPAFTLCFSPCCLCWKEVANDMEYFFGKTGEEQVKSSKAVQKFVQWIHYARQDELELLWSTLMPNT
jgi:hypothetical protein